MRAAQGVLSRIEIKAPVHGVVVKLRYHTAGGVIEPGKPVMEIVPPREDLVIEARVRSRDIDHVEIGQKADVRLTALDQRITPMAHGHVVYVSADAVPDDAKPGQAPDPISRGFVSIQLLHTATRNFKAKPGMPAEVYIQTGARTFFQYLMKPVTDSMNRLFGNTRREQLSHMSVQVFVHVYIEMARPKCGSGLLFRILRLARIKIGTGSPTAAPGRRTARCGNPIRSAHRGPRSGSIFRRRSIRSLSRYCCP